MERKEIEDILKCVEEDIEKQEQVVEQNVPTKTKRPLVQPKSWLTPSIIDDAVASISTDIALAKLVTPVLQNCSGIQLLPHLHFLNECLVQRGFFLHASKEDTWVNFHVAMQKNLKIMTELLKCSKLAGWLCLRVFERLVCENYAEKASEAQSTKCESLREDEVDIIQYICGFVLQRVKKSVYRLHSSNMNSAKLDCVNQLIEACDATTTPSTTRPTLIECKNRGGLICPKQSLLTVFIELEKIFRSKFQDVVITSLNRDDYVEAALSNEHIACSFYETAYNSTASATVKEVVLKEMTTVFFHTRAHSKCRQIMERFRQNSFKTKREKALRKSLAQKSNVKK